ncbi:2-succinyl-5-enolpyruvyl-6-hydroxy-3-cyclohexene-1-carboxylate synthase [Agromyces terreus]|uniref:2-succinyl-5-enolpyruvyl-6-hydroxy-3-cyclohexene-1-carboxylate synthase n=1 Tax=Agromyces terreus TaxID=424795 RepID=A0A9X2KA52_9MICO|nr:2-succinyl-5-enolpyruvyl-6-hydroxy-3-cyclohexene-1-carboxylic-acid synthase [Agromyces terreus]MCP2370013.1 2-succinyl-5-enolpyruvyl-6-hydroxy-3-cyclohexene-1-carboxylate synthase [Agromyces terreus]
MAEPGLPHSDPSAERSPASVAAFALLGGFVRAGVRDVVVAPGSRSQALALAAAELERLGAIRLHVRIDERGAGFLALGLSAESGRPTVVAVTSGTAVANLHPAVLEAHHSGLPLIVCAADRPAAMRGIRSNQTTQQPGIFAGAVRMERDVPAPVGDPAEGAAAARLARAAVAVSMGRDDRGQPSAHPGPGPVHLNLQFAEPLSSAFALDAAPVVDDGDPVAAAVLASAAASPSGSAAPSASGAREASGAAAASGVREASAAPEGQHGGVIGRGPRTVVVAGAGAGPGAEQFARDGGWPLLAEVTSGARFGPNLVVAYRELLREPGFGDLVERVVVFGHPTLSRDVPELVQRTGVETIVVSPSGIEWYNPGHRVRRFERAVHAEPQQGPPSQEARAWLGRWVHASRSVVEAGLPQAVGLRSGVDETGHVSDYPAQREYMRAQLAAVRAPVTRRMLVDAVWAATWPHDRLVLGASRLIRDADRAVPGRRITVHANRGLAGIDGTVATAVGVAVASGAVTRAVIGDLTLLHDAGSMLLGSGETAPRLQVIVGNDGGGTIFDALEVAASAADTAFDRVQYTPQSVDLSALAAAYGWAYTKAATRGELSDALAAPVIGPSLLEVPLAR